MADEDIEAGEGGGGGKKKLIIIIVAALLLFGGGGGAAFFLMSGGDSASQEDIVIEEPEPVSLQAIYVTLPQPFVFNVTGDMQQRLVQVKVQLMVRGDSNEVMAKQNLPLVEHSLLTTFGAATVEQLRTPQGQLEVRKQAVDTVQAAMEKVTGKTVVERVLFTGFVMQ
ncbi:flagellar basal body-associated protein FliL [Enterovibrio norvegicus]|uniref:Flagellar protein FliL n=2 Tax=Enterovibrio norvegicus TaxID=188144 RepID=A0A2N7L5U0_9GAMM|nr:flagellar basal body-associated protein FliL [Enterovibrio norvegicus]MCC4797797.1 flagellar basal body-associated protein FliL [Enterovibrio norvegicus]OEE61932.1 flagellar basal body-associated protein FliL [Enterovibrio norvegicus]OEF58873.1 flagellar basal body-associated protein FliL [Enterovibrio norvegicus]OEF59557.1 flagellar basal body-associated protein FliL [Enterovibrio norvegicus]PMH65622.1 flagellar basal body-associated protein FliL [Enterovibrio norvegicus]